MKGRIGLARRIHYLDEIDGDRPYYRWASSACGKWAGRVEVVTDSRAVTCADCRKIFPPPETRRRQPTPGGVF